MVTNTMTEEEREQKRIRVVIDVNNYKERRFDNIRDIVLQAIDQVKESGQPFELPIMSPAERRVAHMVVQEEEGIETESTGEEGERRVVLKPSKN